MLEDVIGTVPCKLTSAAFQGHYLGLTMQIMLPSACQYSTEKMFPVSENSKSSMPKRVLRAAKTGGSPCWHQSESSPPLPLKEDRLLAPMGLKDRQRWLWPGSHAPISTEDDQF